MIGRMPTTAGRTASTLVVHTEEATPQAALGGAHGHTDLGIGGTPGSRWTMIRSWLYSLGTVLIVTAACHHAPAEVVPPRVTASRAAMDSAEIERLCTAPDGVRAGKADCVLKDQSVRRERLPQSPAAPPR
jgi:hypothetical protein